MMAHVTRFDPDNNRFETLISISLTVEDLVGIMREMRASPHWREGVDRLAIVKPGTDLSDFTLSDMRDRLIAGLEEMGGEAGFIRRNAWVVDDAASTAILKLWEFLPERTRYYSFRVFRSTEEAIAWLAS
jgi:hypothetical protein